MKIFPVLGLVCLTVALCACGRSAPSSGDASPAQSPPAPSSSQASSWTEPSSSPPPAGESSPVPDSSSQPEASQPPAALPEILFRVVDEEGTPACNAMLSIRSPAGQLVDNDFLNAYGEHSMTPRSGAWEGIYTLEVAGQQFQREITAAQPPDQAVEIILSGRYTPYRRNHSSVLTVLLEETGEPIPNLWVSRSEPLQPGEEAPSYMDAGASLLYTDQKGQVFFYASAPGTYEVTITRRGFPSNPVTRMLEPVEDPENPPNQTIFLSQSDLDQLLSGS